MDSSGVKVPIAVAAAANMWTVPLFGVPLTVVGMSVLGASLGAAYGEPIKDRRKLFTTIASHAFLATVLVAVLPAAFGWEWLNVALEAPAAGAAAFVARFVIPVVPWGELIRKVLRLDKKEGDNG